MKTDEIQVKTKLWVEAIIAAKFDGVADELEKILGCDKTIEDTKRNKVIFKLLLYLSHTASKSDKSKRSTGLEIWKIANWICHNMTEMPDGKKFLSSVYHIASCLFDMGIYKEGIKMCDYLSPTSDLWKKNQLSNCEDMYLKVSHLLHSACATMIKTLKFSNENDNYKILLITIRCEFDMTRLGYKNRWRYILSKIISYREKIVTIIDKSTDDCSYLEKKFITFTLDYMKSRKITLGEENDTENNEHTYRLMFSIVNEILLRDITKRRLETMDNGLIDYFEIFRKSLENHQSYLDCFNLYERLSKILVRPIKDLASPPYTVQDIDECTGKLKKLFRFHGNGDAVKWYSYTVVTLLSELLGYWEIFSKNNPSKSVQYLTDDLILSTMNYLYEQSVIFTSYEMTDCRCESKHCEDTKNKEKCNIRYDVYNNIALKLKALSVVSRILNVDKNRIVTSAIYNAAVEFSIASLAGIDELKEENCKHWSSLWPVCGAHSYNIAVFCETKHHTSSVQLYSSMCMYLVKLEGLVRAVNGPNLLNLSSPLSTLLHRLTSTHSNNGNYEEAMIACSLNGLLGSQKSMLEQTKIYSSWINIKNKNPSSRDVTMIECLRANKHEIDKIIDDLHFENYDPIKLCLREIISLSNNVGIVDRSSSIIALLDEIKRLKGSAEIYAQGVQSLGYHLLNLQQSTTVKLNISKYLRKASIDYERETLPSESFRLCYGHIKFYEFYQRIVEIAEKTETEIASVKLALDSRTKDNNGSHSSSLTDPSNIVPLYSTINKIIVTEISSLLERALREWKKAIDFLEKKQDTQDINWQISQTLEMTMITGEYARLYNLVNLELEAWRLSKKLAQIINDHRAIIYTTMRSLTSQYIDEKWIEEADKSVGILEESQDTKVRITIAGYLLSLAELHYDNGNVDTADKLFNLATKKFGAVFMADPCNFLLVSHLRMNQLTVEPSNENYQNAYTRIIVEGLYTMLSIDESTDTNVSAPKIKRLYNNDVLFEFTNNLSPRLNGLLGYREISAHLMRRLGSAQKSGATLRVAECLKSLCYIDLTRAKFDDCEVKLQALEHILEIEAIDLTMKSEQREQPLYSMNPSDNCESTSSNIDSSTRVIEAVRDLGQNDTSPVLRNKIFTNPDFILHGDTCMCNKCTNNRYQSLVFASTHLRAQLYSLRRNETAAQQHFEGALMIKRNILSRKKKLEGLRSYRHLDPVEYVIFHLDYCRFIKWSIPEYLNYAIDIAHDALDLCESYNLKNHPVYVTTNMLIFEFRFDNIYDNASKFSKFTVPAKEDIDISEYIEKSSFNPSTCITPVREILAQKNPISVRRRKTPPFHKLEKVPIDLTEEEPAIHTSPPSRIRPLRRCRNIVEIQETSGDSEVNDKPKKSIVPIIELTSPPDDKKKDKEKDKKDIVYKDKTKNIEISSTEKLTQRRCYSRTKNINSRIVENSSVPVSTVNIYEVTDLLDKMTVKKTTDRTSKNVKTTTEQDISEECQSTDNKGKRTSSRLRKNSQEIASISDKNKSTRSNKKSVSKSED